MLAMNELLELSGAAFGGMVLEGSWRNWAAVSGDRFDDFESGFATVPVAKTPMTPQAQAAAIVPAMSCWSPLVWRPATWCSKASWRSWAEMMRLTIRRFPASNQ